MTDTVHNLVIVGSGPAGYTAAIYAARAGLQPIVVAGAITAGGALMTTTDVDNFPGFPEGIMGPALMENMREQAERFGAEIRYEDAQSLDLTGDIKRITIDEETLQARSVILAMGSQYRHLGVDGEERLSGMGVSYCATCDGFFFRDKVLAVVGGGDSAIEEATFLTRFASKVYVIVRRDQLRASKANADRAYADPKIEFLWNTRVECILGDSKVEGVDLVNTVDSSTSHLPLDGVFVAIGHDPRSEMVADQVALTASKTVAVQGASTATNLPGVFACGDLTDDVYRQAIVAAGSGARAALDAERFLAEAH